MHEHQTESVRDQLRHEIEDVSEPLAGEILDFVRFLKTKVVAERYDIALATEAVLARDWLRPEEDQAWRDL